MKAVFISFGIRPYLTLAEQVLVEQNAKHAPCSVVLVSYVVLRWVCCYTILLSLSVHYVNPAGNAFRCLRETYEARSAEKKNRLPMGFNRRVNKKYHLDRTTKDTQRRPHAEDQRHDIDRIFNVGKGQICLLCSL